LSEKASILKEYAMYIYERVDGTIEGLTSKEAEWKPTEASNSIEWILNHMARLTNVSIPRILKGDPDYMPSGWPEDYREKRHGIEKMISDIEMGKEAVFDGIGKLTSEQLEEMIPLWGGTKKRKTGLFAYLGELIHHRGQIAYVRGTIKRLREKDPKFLI
jgi:uncharacterized damage-inducible protein DinB